MTEGGFPEQRDRFSGSPEGQSEELSVGRGPATDMDGFVFDDAFVNAAPVKELSARSRALEARWRDEPPLEQVARRDKGTAPDTWWSVRPSHKLGSMRYTPLFWILTCIGGALLLLSLLR